MPLDRNAKVRIAICARAWTARHRQPGQHKGPITRAFMEVLQALLWRFHNAHTGRCFPSYEAIAEKAGCARSTVAEALKALEQAGVLTWQIRISRVLVRQRDLFGRWDQHWKVVRTSNAYAFCDPQASKSENRIGTVNQGIASIPAPQLDHASGVAQALTRLELAMKERLLLKRGGADAVERAPQAM